MDEQQYDIFISYRRDGGSSFARTLQLALQNKGYSVFLDFDELKDGVFDKRIEQAIRQAKIFILILSPHALDRCKNEDDWVRREIECAIASQCNIVPVNPDAIFKESFDKIDGLPYFIKIGLGLHQISTIMTNDLFQCTLDNFIQNRIVNIVEPRVHKAKANEAATDDAAEVHFETDLACKLLRFNKEIATLLPDKDNVVYIRRGANKFSFISIENEADQYSQTHSITNDCEIIEVKLTKLREARCAKEAAELKRLRAAELKRLEEERKAAELSRIEDDSKYEIYTNNRLYGFKKNNIEIIPAKYDSAESFSEGLAKVELNSKWGFIDKTGKEVIPLKYDLINPFCEGLAQVTLNEKSGCIDKTGKEVIPCIYEATGSHFSEGLLPVRVNNKWGFIDKTGKEVIPCIYGYVDFLDGFVDGRCQVDIKGNFMYAEDPFYIDKTGRRVE